MKEEEVNKVLNIAFEFLGYDDNEDCILIGRCRNYVINELLYNK